MKKRKRRVRPRAIFCLIAISIFIIAAVWLFIDKLISVNEAPVITLKADMIIIDEGTSFHAEQYITSVEDFNGNALSFSKQEHKKGSYWISGNVDINKQGVYKVIVYALDDKENQAEKMLTVTVENKETSSPVSKPNTADKPNNKGDEGNVPSNIDSGGYDSSIDPDDCEPYYVNGILLVNKLHPLPPSYGELDDEAVQALEKLQSAANSAGYSIPTLSAYRSYDYQGTLYNNYVALDGQEAADTYSARPGFSEHQSGLAFDVGELSYDYGDTAAGKWLHQHCHEYGFIIRYPKDKEKITGYVYEPWHIRYVGKSTAKTIYQKGVTLEEYLGVN